MGNRSLAEGESEARAIARREKLRGRVNNGKVEWPRDKEEGARVRSTRCEGGAEDGQRRSFATEHVYTFLLELAPRGKRKRRGKTGNDSLRSFSKREVGGRRRRRERVKCKKRRQRERQRAYIQCAGKRRGREREREREREGSLSLKKVSA